jgi:predicted glycogen debranching enzyme
VGHRSSPSRGGSIARTGAAHRAAVPVGSRCPRHASRERSVPFRRAGCRPPGAWQPYGDLPPIIALANGDYFADASWYRQFQYDEERARGLDFTEDLAAPGKFTFSLSARAVLAFGTGSGAGSDIALPLLNTSPERCWDSIDASERRRRAAFPSSLHRAADDYIVARGGGKTIIAGYPWFSDWGRDTFIAIRGLCLAGAAAGRDRTADARDILLEWAEHVSQGMLPNFFPEGGKTPEYNSVDASLWYVVAVHEFLRHTRRERTLSDAERESLHARSTPS